MPELNEFKASYGVDAEVAEPTGVQARKLPGSKEQGEKSGPMKQGSSEIEDKLKKRGKQEDQTGAAEGERPQKDSGMNQGSSATATPGQARKVTREDIDIADDIDAIFEGSDLSEDFKNKAGVIFETAVATHVNKFLEEIQEEMNEEFNANISKIHEDLTNKLDEYLDYVVEAWMEENQLAVETGLKAEMTESFLHGLKELFDEHYIDIPEEQNDIVEELASRIEELEASLSQEMEENIEARTKVKEFEREVAFVEVAEGLTETQAAKLESLAEAVEFTDAEEFKTKIETLRENYFPTNAAENGQSRTQTLDEDPVELEEEATPKNIDPVVAKYADYMQNQFGSKKQ